MIQKEKIGGPRTGGRDAKWAEDKGFKRETRVLPRGGMDAKTNGVATPIGVVINKRARQVPLNGASVEMAT